MGWSLVIVHLSCDVYYKSHVNAVSKAPMCVYMFTCIYADIPLCSPFLRMVYASKDRRLTEDSGFVPSIFDTSSSLSMDEHACYHAHYMPYLVEHCQYALELNSFLS